MPTTKHMTQKFSESKNSDEPELDDLTRKTKSELGLRTKSIKNLGVYTGTVVGPWTSDDRNDHCRLAAKVELPGGNIGRLHVSELPSKFLTEHTSPLEEFIKRNRTKSIAVKIIDFTAIKMGDEKVRVAELTMSEVKMSEARKKAKSVAFQSVFAPGSVVRCFISPEQKETTNGIRVEVNPFWSGKVANEAVSDDLKIEGPERDGEVFESLPKAGEMRMAKVLGTVTKKKSHGHGLLNLAFDLQADSKKFESGQKLTARVTHVNYNPISVQFHLANGHQAILCATAIANNYEKVHIHIDSFQRNGIFRLYALRQDRNPLRNFVVTEGRYESYLKQKENGTTLDRRSLLLDRSQVEVGFTCDGFVVKHMPDAILVEIGPGIVGRLRKLSHPEISTIPLNSIVTVKVTKIDVERRISLALVGVVAEAATAVKGRKRAAEEEGASVPKKKTELIPEVETESVPLYDPGFDWSNTGFLPEDLAAVGKLDDAVTVDKENAAKELPPSEKQKSVDEVKKTRVKDTKPTTKEELDMEKERRLIHREVELSGDLQPETQEDFARLLRKDPNSAELWIRYISFFLEKNDLTKARATAERALTVINYREEDEIFNLWTAYLNMEVAYGDEDTTKEIFKRACGNADSYKVHKQMAAIFSENGKNEEADEIYEAMVKKFRANSDDVWTLYGEHLMSTDRAEKARDLMKRALTSVPKQRHVPLISRFAQMEFRKGDFERGRTLFESLVTAYPKKTDVWLVYADMCVKHSGVEEAR
ncbi:tetratricopeptide repeat protein [Oesophagostomum dentatum]|uniref:Tetratricopeptide repeat protein n=1 Tax=Oesophagostomum dentatum TaxID=61180 RepID=A0A0B1T6E7_OESDE|nr:tetratricopeptide repeat protein [Oesophagostomum dentatum]